MVAIGNMVYPTLESARLLAQKGIQAYVVNARFAKPIDQELILSLAEKTGVVITLEENVLAGGFGSGVMEALEEKGINWVRVKRIGIENQFVEHGSVEKLRQVYGLDPLSISQKVEEFFKQEEILPKVDSKK